MASFPTPRSLVPHAVLVFFQTFVSVARDILVRSVNILFAMEWQRITPVCVILAEAHALLQIIVPAHLDGQAINVNFQYAMGWLQI